MLRRNLQCHDEGYSITTPFKVIQGYWFRYQSKACIHAIICNNLEMVQDRIKVSINY